MVQRSPDEPPLRRTNSATLWRCLETHPLWAFAAIVAAQHAFVLTARGLWWSDEVRHGGVLLDIVSTGAWIALRLNGQPYPDKPPLYFWYIHGLQAVLGRQEWVIFLGLALSVLALCVATYRLAISICDDRWIALSAVLVLTAGAYFLLVSHYTRMDILFAALIVESWRSFLRGVRDPILDRRAILSGFAFSAAAAMVKGPVGPLLPVSAFVVWLVLRGRSLQLTDRAVFGGLGGLAAVVALWSWGVVHFGGADYLRTLLSDQVVGRALDMRTGWSGYFRYLVTLPLVFLPWTMIGLIAPSALYARSAATTSLLVCLGTGLLALSLIGEKHEYYLLPVLPLCSILAAIALRALPPERAPRLAVLLALYSFAIGVALIGAPKLLPALGLALPPWTVDLSIALRWPATVAIIAGGGLLLLRWSTKETLLLAFAATQALFINVVIRSIALPLSMVLSPAAIANAMRPAIEAGYEPAVQHGIGGVFAHSLGQHYAQIDGVDPTARWIAATPRAVVALEVSVWSRMTTRFADVEIVGCPSFLGMQFVVIARPPMPDAGIGASLNDCIRH